VHVIRPPRIAPGARVAIVAPAGPVPRARFSAGAEILAARYQLVHDERIFASSGFLAGDDAARRDELQRALGDPTIDAVLCARGGYGAMRILDGLDAAPFARAPKPIVGFSDITALHAWALRAGVAAIHAPVVTHLGVVPRQDAESLFALLESPEPPPPVTGLRSLVDGRAEGRLIGGNLELVTRLVGTPWALDLRDAVLLLEETGERPYRIDGVVLGEFLGCAEKDGSAPDAEAVVLERLGRLGVPIVAGVPVGHGGRNRALPIGTRVRLDATAGTLELLEGAVS
jgi:muramoyltetrapeptide carboxypeptidase